MAAVNIRDTGRNSARTVDVRELADNVVTSWTSVTTGTIAVTEEDQVFDAILGIDSELESAFG